MGQHYGQLSLDERCEIARLHAAGCSRRSIAEALGRDPATISRELKRNTRRDVGYKPANAQRKADERCWKGARLDRDEALREEVLAALKRGWSPEQVAGWLGSNAGRRIISHETIYRFIYAQMRRSNDGAWRNYLPRAKARRGRRGKKGGSAVKTFKNRVSIDERPVSAASRRNSGHWEADLMAFSKYGQNILVAHERRSRLLLLACARASPSTTEPSSRSTGGSTIASEPEPTSATLTALGRRAASKTPSAACDRPCRARPTWPPCRSGSSRPPLTATTQHPENVLAGRPLPKHSQDTSTRCTSNVNPPFTCARDEDHPER